jgi:hypothetical protein
MEPEEETKKRYCVARQPDKKPLHAVRTDTADAVRAAFGDRVKMVSKDAKIAMSDIAVHIGKIISMKAVEMTRLVQKKITVTPAAIKAASVGIVPPTVPPEYLSEWQLSLFANIGTLASKLHALKVTEGARINDLARDNNLYYRPTGAERLLKTSLSKGLRIANDAGVALAIAINLYINKVCDAILEVALPPSKKEGGVMLSVQHILKGIEHDSILNAILKDVIIVGAPLGALSIAGAIPNKKKKAASKRRSRSRSRSPGRSASKRKKMKI